MDDSSRRKPARAKKGEGYIRSPCTRRTGGKRRCLRVCLCLHGLAENLLSQWSNSAACSPLWQPTAVVTVTHRIEARPRLVFGVRRGCKRGAVKSNEPPFTSLCRR